MIMQDLLCFHYQSTEGSGWLAPTTPKISLKGTKAATTMTSKRVCSKGLAAAIFYFGLLLVGYPANGTHSIEAVFYFSSYERNPDTLILWMVGHRDRYVYGLYLLCPLRIPVQYL